MADRDANTIALTDLMQQLVDENLPAIDFDKFRQTVPCILARLETLSEAERELQLLRQDYTGRISGMMKAVAVVDRRREAMSEVNEYLEGLPMLTAERLVIEYRRASTRFREAFPASFGLPAGISAAAVPPERAGLHQRVQTRTP